MEAPAPSISLHEPSGPREKKEKKKNTEFHTK